MIEELSRLAPGIITWSGYEPAIRCDWGSTAILGESGWLVFDPVPLAEAAWSEILAEAPLAAIVLTNGNHERDSVALSRRHHLEILAPKGARGEVPATRWLEENESVFGLTAISLPGGAPGETAYCDGKNLILGDALIHFEDLMVLPDKYCTRPKELRKNLSKLNDLAFERICFAHGTPIVEGARAAISGLLSDL